MGIPRVRLSGEHESAGRDAGPSELKMMEIAGLEPMRNADPQVQTIVGVASSCRGDGFEID